MGSGSDGELNRLLNQHHTFGDPALLRRELFERGLVNRLPNGSAYWLEEINTATDACPEDGLAATDRSDRGNPANR